MISKFIKIIVFIVFVYFLFISMQPARFYIWYPTIQTAYPNNVREIGIIVRDYLPMRTPENIQFFRLTDASPLEAFRGKISDEQFQRLKKKVVSPQVIGKIMYYKKLYNRARPSQIAPELVRPLYSRTANTPALPSGHAYQAFYAAKLLSKLVPERKKEWDAIAERCADIRIIAGLHYPSDRDLAKELVKEYL